MGFLSLLSFLFVQPPPVTNFSSAKLSRHVGQRRHRMDGWSTLAAASILTLSINVVLGKYGLLSRVRSWWGGG